MAGSYVKHGLNLFDPHVLSFSLSECIDND